MNDNISIAVAYYLNGSIFQASAKKLMEGLELDSSGRPATLMAIPMYFLASHAAELFLKAALLKRGLAPAELKKFDYGHSLAGVSDGHHDPGIQDTKNPSRGQIT